MNILLTGAPRSGKSTLLEQVILEHPASKKGLLTREIKHHNRRIGFQTVSYSGKTALLASTQIFSPINHGKYYIHPGETQALISDLHDFQDQDLLYIDEIGAMQLHVPMFQELVTSYLDAPNMFIGTIIQNYNHSFIHQLKARTNVQLITITPENRDLLKNQLQEFLQTP